MSSCRRGHSLKGIWEDSWHQVRRLEETFTKVEGLASEGWSEGLGLIADGDVAGLVLAPVHLQ